ncbi:MAG: hypothetical protein CMF41_02925 [Legionellales bacterium]|nr:hypothetical protein [Legionellales bacterium]
MKIEHAIIKKMSYKVFFHIQNDQDTMTPISFFLKVIIDYFEKGFGLKVVCQDHCTCELFDDALWSYPSQGFIPHFMEKNICWVNQTPNAKDSLKSKQPLQLLNASWECLKASSEEDQIIECIPNDPFFKFQGRERYKFYKDHHFNPEVIKR